MEQHDQSHWSVVGRVQLYTFLGAGAVTFGVGAALAVGSGVAQADSDTAHNLSASSAADAAKGRTQGPIRTPAKASRVRSTIAESQLKSSGNPVSPAATRSTSSLRPSLNSAMRSVATDDPTEDDIAKSGRSPVEVIESRAQAGVGLLPAAAAAAFAQNPVNTPTTATTRVASAAIALTPKDNLDIAFSGLNGSIGWIPVVGTAINGVKFALDSVSLATSVITFDISQAITELGNLVVDTIGLVPVVGAPVASLLSQTVLGVNVKLGALVQEGLQNFFAGDSSWSSYQFNVDKVDVAIGLGGSQDGTATVSKPTYPGGVPVIVDITNNGFEIGWSVPLEGRLQLFRLSFL